MRDAVGPEEMRELRIAAAELANESLGLYGEAGGTPSMAAAAQWQDFWLARILAPQATTLTATFTITDNHGHVKAQFTSTGGTMATSMTMDDTFTITGGTADDHQDPTSDTLVFTGSDGGTVFTLSVSGNTCTGTPVAEGEATITQTDPAAPNVAPITYDITVGPGPTSQQTGTIVVNTGANAAPAA